MIAVTKALAAERAALALIQQSDHFLCDAIDTANRVAGYHANLEWRGIKAKPKKQGFVADLLDAIDTANRAAGYHANLEWRGIKAKPKKQGFVADLLTRFCAWGA